MLENLNKILVSIATALLISGIVALFSMSKNINDLFNSVNLIDYKLQELEGHIEKTLNNLVTKDQNELDKLKLRSEITKTCK